MNSGQYLLKTKKYKAYRKLDRNSFVYFLFNEKNCRESGKQQQNFFVISRCAAAYFIILAVWKDLK